MSTIRQILDKLSNGQKLTSRELDILTNRLEKSDSSRGNKESTVEAVKRKATEAKDAQVQSLSDIGQALLEATGDLGEILTPLEQVISNTRLYRAELENLAKSGIDITVKNYASAIQAASDESLRLTGNLKAAQGATKAMRAGFSGLAFASKTLNEQLMKNATAMEAAGFYTDEYAKIIDSSVFSFNLSEEAISGVTAKLLYAKREFQLAPAELTKNFQYAQKNFAYSSKGIMDNFLKLQKMSKMTGVSFDKLAGSFGESMDTFEGSAQMAGRLNQILGGSLFNSIDLLNKTEAERAKTIRQVILKRFVQKGKSIDDLGKFELIAIAKSLNMGTEETRRFLRTGAPKAAKGLEELQKKNPVVDSNVKLGDELRKLTSQIRAFQTTTEKARIQESSIFKRDYQAYLRATMGDDAAKAELVSANQLAFALSRLILGVGKDQKAVEVDPATGVLKTDLADTTFGRKLADRDLATKGKVLTGREAGERIQQRIVDRVQAESLGAIAKAGAILLPGPAVVAYGALKTEAVQMIQDLYTMESNQPKSITTPNFQQTAGGVIQPAGAPGRPNTTGPQPIYMDINNGEVIIKGQASPRDARDTTP